MWFFFLVTNRPALLESLLSRCTATVDEGMTPDNIKCADACVSVGLLTIWWTESWHSGSGFLFNVQSPFQSRYKLPASLSHIVTHYCLINCSFGCCLRYVENFWDSFNPSSLSLIALDAQKDLFSSPLEQHFVWSGLSTQTHTYTLKEYTQTNMQKKQSKHTDMYTRKLTNIFKSHLHCEAKKKRDGIGRSVFSLTHLALLLHSRPTQYTYTRALKSSSHRRFHLTHFYSAPLF